MKLYERIQTSRAATYSSTVVSVSLCFLVAIAFPVELQEQMTVV